MNFLQEKEEKRESTSKIAQRRPVLFRINYEPENKAPLKTSGND